MYLLDKFAMNKKQLMRLGVPQDCVPLAVEAVQRAAKSKNPDGQKPKKLIPRILETPEVWLPHADYGDFARGLIAWRNAEPRSDPAHSPE